HTRFSRDWSSDVCSSDLENLKILRRQPRLEQLHIGWRVVNDENPSGHDGRRSSGGVEVVSYGLEKLRDRNWFGEIGLTAAFANTFLIALHGEGRDRDDGNRLQLLVLLQPFRH